MKVLLVLPVIILLGVGCQMPPFEDVPLENTLGAYVEDVPGAVVTLPVMDYVENRFFKSFGEYISDRFVGYHVADDVEYVTTADEVRVSAIMDGIVVRVGNVSGYGGMMLVDHGEVNAIYGHVDLSSVAVAAGDQVTGGQFLANLGDHESAETDGERKHLHFALYTGEPTQINGYVSSAAAVDDWLNPQDFFTEHGFDMTTPERIFGPEDRGGDVFALSFAFPENMEVEYVPSLKALNIFTLSGSGTARERSQIFIRYFDAEQFLTLSTVNVFSTEETTVGQEDYSARRYEIEKKSGVADFADQPSWRNLRHIVTDFTDASGYGRYYVVAANPELDPSVYEEFLASIRVVE